MTEYIEFSLNASLLKEQVHDFLNSKRKEAEAMAKIARSMELIAEAYTLRPPKKDDQEETLSAMEQHLQKLVDDLHKLEEEFPCLRNKE